MTHLRITLSTAALVLMASGSQAAIPCPGPCLAIFMACIERNGGTDNEGLCDDRYIACLERNGCPLP